jgi:glycosyltransferase involved in cell wall biosynthesis
MPCELSIVTPAFNESSGLPHALDTIKAIAAKASDSYEIIVVDDGSTDDTPGLMIPPTQGRPR